MDVLDELLDGYVARKRAERSEFDRQQAASIKSQAKAQRLISAVALPVLKEVAESVQAKGHHCKVKEHSGPRVVVSLDFQPSTGDDTPFYFPSILFVSADDQAGVTMSQNIVQIRGSTLYRSETQIKLAELSEAKVREQVTDFIASAVKAN